MRFAIVAASLIAAVAGQETCAAPVTVTVTVYVLSPYPSL